MFFFPAPFSRNCPWFDEQMQRFTLPVSLQIYGDGNSGQMGLFVDFHSSTARKKKVLVKLYCRSNSDQIHG